MVPQEAEPAELRVMVAVGLAAAQVETGADLLSLRGTGRGLWGADAGQTVADLRNEWDGA